MKKILIILTILAVFLIGLGVWQSLKKYPFARINNYEFKLQVTKTPKDYEIGLSKYENLSEDIGMLFSFKKPDYYSFWMKQMKFPIDIIYIKDGEIVTIYKNVKPPKSKNESLTIYKPRKPANMVLEINAGLSDKYKFKEGDKVSLNNI